MTWTVIFTPEFEQRLYDQEPCLQHRVNAALLTLELTGPALGRPRVDTLFGSFYPNMKSYICNMLATRGEFVSLLIIAGKR